MDRIGEDRIHQLFVAFGCRTLPIAEVKPDQGRELIGKLKAAWPDLFGQEASPSHLPGPPGEKPLLGLEQSFYMKEGLATIGTLVVVPESSTINVPRRLGGSAIRLCREDLWLKDKATNTKARTALMHVTDVLGVAPHRAGKIYDIVLHPVTPEESKALFQHLCPSIKEDAVEYNVNATIVRTVGDRQYNVVLQLTAKQLQGLVVVKVDVNNRDMERSLDPRDLDRVFETADELMPSWLFNLLRGDIQ